MKKKRDLRTLRGNLTELEKRLIQQIWDSFESKGEWPLLRLLYRDHGKSKVKAALRRLGPGIGREDSGGNRWHRYSLLLPGALLSKNGLHMEKLMVGLFVFQRHLFQNDPPVTEGKSEDIKTFLKLSDDDVELLGKLVRLAGFGGSYSPGRSPWTVSAMEEAEDFPKQGNLETEFHLWLFKNYDRDNQIHRQVEFSPTRSYYQRGELASDPSHPPEISLSLGRLRQRFPDSTKLGFLVMRFTPSEPFSRIVKVVKETAKKHGLTVVRADDTQFHGDVWGNVRTLLHGCGFGIAVYERIDQEEPNANVGLEVGYLMAMNKPVLLLKDKSVRALQTDLAGKLYVPFDPHAPEKSIPGQLTSWLRDNGLLMSER